MEYYSAIKNNDFRKFLGKWMEVENIIMSEVTQSQKNTHSMHSLIGGYNHKAWYTQDTTYIACESQEDQRYFHFFLEGKKLPMGGDTETKVE